MDATQVLWTGDAPSDKDAQDEQPYAELLVYKNDSDMTDVIKHPLHRGENKIGRGDEADVKIDSVSLSRIHAVITINPEVQEYGIEDEKSTNGTRLGEGKGKRLKPNKEYELKHGQFVTFGEIKCRFEVLPVKEKETEAAEVRTPVIDADATQAYFPDEEETKPSPQTHAVSRPVAAPAASFDATQLYVDDVPVSSVKLPSIPQTGALAPTFEPTQLYVEEPVGGGSPLYHNSNHDVKHDTNATQLYIEDTPKKMEEEETEGHNQGQVEVKATAATCEPTQMYMDPSPVLITATCEPTQEYVPPPAAVGQQLPAESTVSRAPTCEPTQEYIAPVGVAAAVGMNTPPTRHAHAGSGEDSDATVAESEDEETTTKNNSRAPVPPPTAGSNRESITSIATEDDDEDWLFKAKPPVRPANVAGPSTARSSSTSMSREPIQDDLLSLYEESERPKPLQPAVTVTETDEVKTTHADESPSVIESEPKFSTPVKEHGSPFEIRGDDTKMEGTPIILGSKTPKKEDSTRDSEEEKRPVRGSTRAKKRTQKVIEEEEEAAEEEQKPAKTTKKRAKKADDEKEEGKGQIDVKTATPVQPAKDEKKRKRGVKVSASKENDKEEDQAVESHEEATPAKVKPAAKSKKKAAAIVKTPSTKGFSTSLHTESEQTPAKPTPEKLEKAAEIEDKMEVDEPHAEKATGKGKRTTSTSTIATTASVSKGKGKGKGKQTAKEKAKNEAEMETEADKHKAKEQDVATSIRKTLPARAKRGKNARLHSDEEDEAPVAEAEAEARAVDNDGEEEEGEKKKKSTPQKKAAKKDGGAAAAKKSSGNATSTKKRKLNEKSMEIETESKQETLERKSQKKEEEEEEEEHGEEEAEALEEDVAAPAKKRRTSQGVPSSLSPQKRGDTHTTGQLKLLFTGVVPDGWAKEMKHLGATVCDNVQEPFTHLVTDKVKRTVKFLSAVGKGSHIVTTKWLDESYKAKQRLDEKKFAVKDPAAEKQFGFSLARSLQKANEQPLLAGKKVYITPNVVPKPQDFAEIIECSGGKLRASPPSSFDEHTLVMSAADDKKSWPSLVSLGYTVYSNELLLTGVLKQELELQKHILASPASSSAVETGSKSTGKRRRS